MRAIDVLQGDKAVNKNDPTDLARRSFVKRSAYVAPAILTLPAAPEYAKAGSVKPPKQPKPRKSGKGYV